MKKYTFFLVIIVIISGACKQRSPEIVITPDSEKNHLQINGLKGKVQTLLSELYAVEERAGEDSTYRSEIKISGSIQHYSPDGYLLQVFTLNDTDDTVSIRKISYRQDAKQDYWTEEDATGAITASCKYEYDMNGQLAEEKRYVGDSLILSIHYRNDAEGNVIAMTQDFGTYRLRNTMQYNQDGLLERVDEYDPNDKRFKYITFEYDNYGDLVNRRVYRNSNTIIEYSYTEYDQKGRIMKVLFEDRIKNIRESSEYSGHDASGNWTSEIRKIGDKEIYVRKRQLIYY